MMCVKLNYKLYIVSVDKHLLTFISELLMWVLNASPPLFTPFPSKFVSY